MEAEKVHLEKVARTIQQKQDGGGALQFVDEHVLGIAKGVDPEILEG